MSIIDGMSAAGMGMQAQAARLNAISGNIANMDTVASSEKESFKALMVNFKTVNVGGAQGVVATHTTTSTAPSVAIYAPNNPFADEFGYVYGSNVNRAEQLVDLASAEQSYKANANVAKTLKDLALQSIKSIRE
ncbi:flagellar basal body rod protein FlgC [Vibrio fortis]|uniref:flagellar basal body rod protein FlgC n=1 Tax=Vibrio fortis TaxID=212667 RepID=UPI0040694B54